MGLCLSGNREINKYDDDEVSWLLRRKLQNFENPRKMNFLVTENEIYRRRKPIPAYLVCSLGCRSGWELEADSIATFSVDSKSGRELRPYLSSVTDKCEQNAADLPKVIIIDGLHRISSPLSDAFNGFLSVDYKSR